MKYDLKNGQDLLNRLSVLNDYLKKCQDQSQTKAEPSDQIATNLVNFLHLNICNYASFDYDNLSAPGAFSTDQTLHLPRIAMQVDQLLTNQYEKLTQRLHVQTVETFINHAKQLSTAQLIQLTQQNERYIVVTDRTDFHFLTFAELEPVLSAYFNAELLQKLIEPEPIDHFPLVDENDPVAVQSPEIQKNGDDRTGIDYHFTKTQDFIKDHTLDENDDKES